VQGYIAIAAPAGRAVYWFLAASRWMRTTALLLLGTSLLNARANAQTGTGPLPTLTTIGAVHQLSFKEASRYYPVHATAVITYYDPYLSHHPGRPCVMVTDATGSIYLSLAADIRRPLKAGMLVEVTGRSDPGDFAPNISQARIRVMGRSALLANPPQKTMTQLLTGAEDSQWVELEGLVKSVQKSGENITLKLSTGDGEIAATTVREPGADYDALVDAVVRIHGIARSLYNHHRQIFGVQLLFPSLEAVSVEEAASSRPFTQPVTPIANLMRYTPGRTINHRLHVRGTVTLFWPGRLLCVEDDSGSFCAGTAETIPLTPGDLVDVVGFPQVGNVSPTLTDTTYRALPGAYRVSVSHLDASEAFGGEHDAQLVQIEGRLIAHESAAEDPTLQVSSGKFTFPVVLPRSADAQNLLKLEKGSLIRITGICSVQADAKVFTRHDGYPVTKFFEIMLRSSADVVVLRKPSWWTTGHTLRVVAAAFGTALCTLCWLMYLQMQVKKQADLLEFQATHDGLTGVWNRRAVLDLMRREYDIAARSNKMIGVVMLDADHFKRVNDTYGHLAGDAVLKELAKRIQGAIRSYDLTGRYGGEEFLIVLPDCTEEDVLICAERVRVAVASQPILAEGSELMVTVSLGTAILDPLINTQRDALAAADSALYQAKHFGRNRVVSGYQAPDTRVNAPTSNLQLKH
jgi:diguanylate cyclase (GGDEF)-like protein